MMNTSFLHVADIHLDSPLAHLQRVDEATAEQLRRATRRSLELIVSAALERQVAAVVIAGDLFDGPVKDASAGLWVESQFRRLTRSGIRVVLIRGNHDAVSNAQRIVHWSTGIDELSTGAPESVVLEEAGLAIHGQSFGARAETSDLAASYPESRMGFFNIGLLHTSLSGSSQHDAYAPTSIGVLESKGYDYWALGHIHIRSPQPLSNRTFVGYSGNTQGRHIREAGKKGCQLVNVRDGHLDAIEFIATDSLRWHEICLDLDEVEHLADIEDLAEMAVAEHVDASEGRPLALRLRLQGATRLHSELTRSGTAGRLAETCAARLSELAPVWIESVKVASRPLATFDSDEVLLPLKYMEAVTQELRTNENARQELLGQLEDLLRKARPELSEIGWPLVLAAEQSDELTRLVGMAEDMLVARLAKEGTA